MAANLSRPQCVNSLQRPWYLLGGMNKILKDVMYLPHLGREKWWINPVAYTNHWPRPSLISRLYFWVPIFIPSNQMLQKWSAPHCKCRAEAWISSLAHTLQCKHFTTTVGFRDKTVLYNEYCIRHGSDEDRAEFELWFHKIFHISLFREHYNLYIICVLERLLRSFIHDLLKVPGFWLYGVLHYNDVIMNLMASQITSVAIVYSNVYSHRDQRKHQSSASLAFVRGIHRGPVNSPHTWPVTRKMFPFDDVIMLWRPCQRVTVP